MNRFTPITFLAGLLAVLPARAGDTTGTLLLWSGRTLTIATPPDGRSTAYYLDEGSLWNTDPKPVVGGRVHVIWEVRGSRTYCTYLEAAGTTAGKREYIFARSDGSGPSFLGHITRRRGNSISFEALNGTVYNLVTDSSTDFSGFPKDSYAIPTVRIYYTAKGSEYHVVKFVTL